MNVRVNRRRGLRLGQKPLRDVVLTGIPLLSAGINNKVRLTFGREDVAEVLAHLQQDLIWDNGVFRLKDPEEYI